MKFILTLALFPLLTPTALCQDQTLQLDSLSWLAGCWEAHFNSGAIVSEQWTKPLGNMMMCMSVTVKAGRVVEYETVRLEKRENGSIHYVAHPSGQEEASFRLVRLQGHEAFFENLQHDFPQRIIYRLVSSDSLLARVEGTVNGSDRRSDFPYRRVKCD